MVSWCSRRTGETQRQHICALTLEEDESEGPVGDFLAADWRRNLNVRRLKKTEKALKEEMVESARGRRKSFCPCWFSGGKFPGI